MTELVATHIGGTHARFALARLDGEGRVAALDEPVVLRCADHASLHDAWECFGTTIDHVTDVQLLHDQLGVCFRKDDIEEGLSAQFFTEFKIMVVVTEFHAKFFAEFARAVEDFHE